MNYVIAQGVPPFVTYYSERAGRDYGAAGIGWVRDEREATTFATESDAQEFMERALLHQAADCRIESTRTPGTEDPYVVLGIPHTATRREITAAFRRLAMKHHPDRNMGDDSAAERFKKARAAYHALRAICQSREDNQTS